MKCPKCNNEMEEGSRFGGGVNEIWISSSDRRELITHKFPIKYKKGKPVKTLACQKCGYLESYLSKE